MIHQSRRSLLLSLPALLLSGCGYQLRGFHDGDESSFPFRHVLISNSGADSAVVDALKRVLLGFGCELVTDDSKAELEVWLGTSTQQSVPSAIGSYGEISARLYVLTQPVRIRKVGQDSSWLVDTSIRRSREVDQSLLNYVAPNASSQFSQMGAERPLAISRESEEVLVDIRARVVDAIVRLVQRLTPLDQSS
jgi:outer membrane lipopolysaccharide assembly protein LptE/RlpB